ncbi:hypothetical protein J2W96_002324 [Variovorax guangxiensis]|nr:hypothetical protein [Variovorax guangxiensis]
MKKTFLLHIDGKKPVDILAKPAHRKAQTTDVSNTAS